MLSLEDQIGLVEDLQELLRYSLNLHSYVWGKLNLSSTIYVRMYVCNNNLFFFVYFVCLTALKFPNLVSELEQVLTLSREGLEYEIDCKLIDLYICSVCSVGEC